MHTTQRLLRLRAVLDSAITYSQNIDIYEQGRKSSLYSHKGFEASTKLLDTFRPALGAQIEKLVESTRELGSEDASVDAVIRAMGEGIEDSAELRKTLSNHLAVFSDRFSSSRAKLLSDREREVLSKAMAETRHNWDNTWIGDVVENGYFGTALQTDINLIEDALCDNFTIPDILADEDRIALLEILVRDDVLDIVIERFLAYHDQDSLEGFVSELGRLTDTLTAPETNYARVDELCDAIVDKIDNAAMEQPDHDLMSLEAPGAGG